jgi:serine/threonine protein kinase
VKTPELSDKTLEHLRRVADWPDFEGTRYEVLREVARGGMGVVYLARDRELDRPVALKVLSSTEMDSDAAERLKREAAIIAGLEHPGIVPVHDVGTLGDGRTYYAMKLVSGSRLDALVRAPRPLGELLRLFLRICEPVAFAHAHGVIHRDLKPENVMVGPFGEVLVMDWGVAQRSAESSPPGAPHEKGTGTILGTPGYMAPEQARGEAVDARADVYALGATLYFILTGEAPGSGGTKAPTRTWAAYAGPRPPAVRPPRWSDPEVPRAVEAICLKALATEAKDRYPGALALAKDVERFLEGGPVSAYPENLWRRARRFQAKYRTAILFILAYIVLRALLLFVARV